jgi:hypothetical protein
MGSRGELKLGNLLDGTFRFNEAPMRCRQERCPCEFRWIAQ